MLLSPANTERSNSGELSDKEHHLACGQPEQPRAEPEGEGDVGGLLAHCFPGPAACHGAGGSLLVSRQPGTALLAVQCDRTVHSTHWPGLMHLLT